MNGKSLFTSSFLNRGVFAVSLIVLIFISFSTYRHTLGLSNSIDRMVHANDVRNELERLISAIKDAETGQRGFIITKDSTFLEPFYGAKLKSNRSFARLVALMDKNKQQKVELDSLSFLINSRFELLKSSLLLSSEPGTDKEAIVKKMLSQTE